MATNCDIGQATLLQDERRRKKMKKNKELTLLPSADENGREDT